LEAADALVLKLEGFEGPLDLLLDLARAQKVDLARISILQLVEQFLAVIEGARRVRLELAADWLVMAAWLAWLKSRLLLPDDPVAAEEGEAASGLLAARLQTLEQMRAAAVRLAARPQLGHEMFRRGAPERLVATDRSALAADLAGLVRAYLAAARRRDAQARYRPVRRSLWRLQDALARLERLLGATPDWLALERFLPETLRDPLERRAALASTLLAGLEVARGGAVELRQEAPFGPIALRRGDAGGVGEGRAGEGGAEGEGDD
jgi:segregation and condensation protein A